MENKKISGNSVSWQMTCTGRGGTVHSRGKIAYHGDTFNGEMHVTHEEYVVRKKDRAVQIITL